MTRRRIAILIDGGFFLKRLPKLVKPSRCATPEATAVCIRYLCKSHIKRLCGDVGTQWQQHVYRIFFYDALPFDGKAHHPLTNRQVDFDKSDLAVFRRQLFDQLRHQRKVALRLGQTVKERDWQDSDDKRGRKLLSTMAWIDEISLTSDGESHGIALTPDQKNEFIRLQTLWRSLQKHEVRLGLRQKGVDMRIGLDIASITLKRQADTIVLIAGDADFVPAAKLARREGMEFILDPLWQKVSPDLFEHIDGLQSGLPNPAHKKTET